MHQKITFSGLIALFGLCVLPGVAQAQTDETAAIKAVIERFFDGLEKSDTVVLKSACTDMTVLQSFIKTKTGAYRIVNESFGEFLTIVAQPHKEVYDERISYESIMIEPALASVWTPYEFFIDGRRSHCGTNSFQLVKTAEGWRIQYIIDTRRKDCD
ncbi:MAG: hypothetical protein IT269_03535 [Saprospiraceae bacterium]|nr:hypothetical protein [Saprospiraceae bacterium]